MKAAVAMVALVAAVMAGRSAHAQARPPFFGQGVTAFDPVIDVVNSGVLSEVQAAVSPDRKHVTMNTQASLAHVIEFKTFEFQVPGGFVGGANLPANANNLQANGVAANKPPIAAAGGNALGPPPAKRSAARQAQHQDGTLVLPGDTLPDPVAMLPVLERAGMTKVSGL